MECRYFCPILTSMNDDGNVNFEDMHALYDQILGGGIDGILTGGSAGEFYAFSYDEVKELITDATRYINHRGFVLAGTGRCVKEETISLSNDVLAVGADAVIIVGPYYSGASEEDIYEYYDEVMSKVNGPIFMYNFADRTGYDIPARTVLRLRDRHDNFIGIKDTHPVVRHTQSVIQLVKGKYPDFIVMTGYDNNFMPVVLSGGDGCIGALSNIYPETCHQAAEALRHNDLEQMKKYQREIDRLFAYYEVYPTFNSVMKWAMKEMGKPMQENCRVPVRPLPAAAKEQLKDFADAMWRK